MTDAAALARLAFDELGAAAGGVGEIHRAVAGRVFRAVGAGGRPVEMAHDAIAGGVYAAVRASAHGAGRVAGAALKARGPAGARPLDETPRGAAAIGTVNGLIGDTLEREADPLALPMAVRVRGRPVAPEPTALAAAFPGAGGRLVVFVHGLMETELAWRTRAGAGGETYATRLTRDLGATAVEVRYNSGRRISRSGRSLAGLLEAVVAGWPVPVEQIALVGHSMGGLVARSGCHQAALDGAPWVDRVGHVVSLGSPHMGAPLEQAVHHASAALHAVPETRPLGRFLRRRSGGIRDLRRGSLVDEDWHGRDADALRSDAATEVPLLDGVTHCFVAATVTRSPRHPIGRLIGDWLVLEASASGRSRSRRLPFAAEHGLHVGGVHHFALLNHPDVYPRLRDWLATPPERLAAAGEPG